MKINRRLQSVISILFAVLLLGTGTLSTPTTSAYAKTGETVRVGYFSERGMMNGAAGGELKSGYACDYLQELASYAGRKYEYVYGSFSDLYNMLLKGEIDMLPYLTKTKEREQQMLFPDKAMGEEEFYISSMTAGKLHDDLRELQDAKIGTEKGTFHIGPFRELIAEKNLT